jgi:hypothetical protein
MAALDTSVLSDLQAEQRTLRIYFRHVRIPEDGSAPDPIPPSVSSGRWATPGGTLYTAVDEPTVWAEYCRSDPERVSLADPTGGIGLNPGNFTTYASREVGAPLPLRTLFSVDVAFNRLVDLTTDDARGVLVSGGFDTGDFLADDYGDCPSIATAGEGLGWEAVLVPSAAWQRPGGQCVPVFLAGRPLRSAFNIVRAAARPTVAVAFLASYRAGQQPAWLSMA